MEYLGVPPYLTKQAESNYFFRLKKRDMVSGTHLAPKATKDGIAFLNGGWLEDLVFEHYRRWLSDPELGIQDVARNIKVEWIPGADSEPVRQEIDVAVLAHNTFYLIECKSGLIERAKLEETKKVIFQLGRIRQKLGGLRGRAVLVILEPLSPSLLSRCKDNQIVEVSGNPTLKKLPDVLRQIIW